MRSLCLPAFYPDDHDPEDRARRWLWQDISGEPDASDPDEEVPEFGLTQATGKLVIFGKGFDHYAVLMIKTPEQLRAEAQEYRDLLNVMARPVLNVAIEDMAKALERSADALEEASSAA
jgi:hypothetical protein